MAVLRKFSQGAQLQCLSPQLNAHIGFLSGDLLNAAQALRDGTVPFEAVIVHLAQALSDAQQSHSHGHQKQHHQRCHQVRKGDPERFFCIVLAPPLGGFWRSQHMVSAGIGTRGGLAQVLQDFVREAGLHFSGQGESFQLLCPSLWRKNSVHVLLQHFHLTVAAGQQ